ncbi:MAG: hypothetical protein JRJ49_04840 [Deltaproteobacteria bacterium]|nr:hypothetical protein [Deltaproteobacteria bacterium]
MKQEIKMLIELQSFEDIISNLTDSLEKIPIEINKLQEELSESKKEVENIENSIAQTKKAYNEFDAKIKDNTERVKKNDNNLMSVQTNKEYNAILKAISDLKLANSDMEDQMIAYLDQMEQENQKLKASKEKLAEAVKKIKNKQSLLEKELARKKEELNKTVEKKEIKINALPQSILKIYNNVKKIKGNKVITAAVKGICKGCNLNIPVQEYIKIQKAESIAFCPNCQRIIYYEDSENTE